MRLPTDKAPERSIVNVPEDAVFSLKRSWSAVPKDTGSGVVAPLTVDQLAKVLMSAPVLSLKSCAANADDESAATAAMTAERKQLDLGFMARRRGLEENQ